MLEDADRWCRVQIAGRGFSVAVESDKDDTESLTILLARTIARAIGMMSYRVPCTTKLLAGLVDYLAEEWRHSPGTLHGAEDTFFEAAAKLIRAWEDCDKRP